MSCPCVLTHAPSEISPCSLLLGAETKRGGDSECQVHTRMAECRIKDQKLNAPSLLKLVFLKKKKKKSSKGWGRLKLPRYAAGGWDCWGISHDTPSRSSLPLCFAFCSYLCPIINAYQSFSLFLWCVSAPLSLPISGPQQLRSAPKFLPPKKAFFFFLLLSTFGPNEWLNHEII